MYKYLLFFVLFVTSSVFPQSINIYNKDGSISKFQLNEIDSITFENNTNNKNIASQASISYSSISTDSYKGYVPNAKHTVDGIIRAAYNLWSAQSFSGSGWICYEFQAKKDLAEIHVFAGTVNYGALYYSVQYMDDDGNWVDLTTPNWVNTDLSGCYQYSTDNGVVYEYIIDASSISTKGIRINITNSQYPSTHLWRTPVTEVEIIEK